MNKIPENRIEKVLTFDVFKNIINDCNFNLAHYLQIIDKIRVYNDLNLESYKFKAGNLLNNLVRVSEIKKMLNYKDLRSVVNWCRKNSVFVIEQGNSMFVCKSEFLIAFQKPFIEHLKRTYENWKERFENYMDSNYQNLLGAKKEVIKSTSYTPTSKIEKSFLNKMKNL